MSEVAGLAYSLSKQMLMKEMEEFDNYNDMKMFEFYEFLVRLACLLFETDEYGKD